MGVGHAKNVWNGTASDDPGHFLSSKELMVYRICYEMACD